MRRRRKYLWVVLILGLLLAAAGFGTYLLPRLPAGSSEMLHHATPVEPAVEAGPVSRPAGPAPVPAVIHYRDKIVVLAYHHLAPEETPDETATLSVAHFREHLDVLQANDYVIVSLADIENFLKGEEIPPNAVAITFDDGYESFYTATFSELGPRGMSAAVFPIVSRIGTTRGTPKLTWEEIRELVQQDIEVHSHSYDGHLMGRRGDKQVAVLTGPVYRKEWGRVETRQEYRARVAEDIATAQNFLAVNAGINDTYFSYPYGRSSSDLRQALEGAGYHLAFTFTPAAVTRSSDPLALPRVNAGGPGTGGKELLELMAEATK